MNLEKVGARSRLEVRREPYWHPIESGRHLGFRKTKSGGTWHARAYDSATRGRLYHAIPEALRFPLSMQFSEATKLARRWFDHLDQGGVSESITVLNACERYVEHLRREKSEAAANDAARRVERDVAPHQIARVGVQKLRHSHVKGWRDFMRDRPAKQPKRGLDFNDQPDRNGKPKSSSTLNRDMTFLRAALNHAKREGYVTSDMAWSQALTPVPDADGKRETYLDPAQRRIMLEALVGSEIHTYIQALCLLPLRPGTLAKATASDFDRTNRTLLLRSDKAKSGRKIPLSQKAVRLIEQQLQGKPPNAPIFSRVDGREWDKDSWKRPVKCVVKSSGLPSEATLYTLRHSVITDLVTGGLDLFTVATLAGTSIRMIEKHYGHLRQEHARAALDKLDY